MNCVMPVYSIAPFKRNRNHSRQRSTLLVSNKPAVLFLLQTRKMTFEYYPASMKRSSNEASVHKNTHSVVRNERGGGNSAGRSCSAVLTALTVGTWKKERVSTIL